MRPVRRGASPQTADFQNYRAAFPELVSRLGSYCTFCERRIVTQLAVEHIQPKGLSQYAALEGRWENFLLACVNCNSTKGDKDLGLADVLLPDRDNTFAAVTYQKDGTLAPAAGLDAAIVLMTKSLLTLIGLDKPISAVHDENGRLVAIDRVSQRMEAWLTALDAKSDVDGQPNNDTLRHRVVRHAQAEGFFSIWMSVFAADADMRKRLIDAFAGARESGCFNQLTSMPVTPAPNPDGLPNGAKA